MYPSSSAGLPTWSSLKQKLLKSLKNKIETLADNDKNRLLSKYSGINNETNYWIAFERLKNALGQTTYRDTIRDTLQDSASRTVPVAY